MYMIVVFYNLAKWPNHMLKNYILTTDGIHFFILKQLQRFQLILHYVCKTVKNSLRSAYLLMGYMEKDPSKRHLIYCKILLENYFLLPGTKRENLSWDQESLKGLFFLASLQLIIFIIIY